MYKCIVIFVLSSMLAGCSVTVYDGRKEAEKAKIDQLNQKGK